MQQLLVPCTIQIPHINLTGGRKELSTQSSMLIIYLMTLLLIQKFQCKKLPFSHTSTEKKLYIACKLHKKKYSLSLKLS